MCKQITLLVLLILSLWCPIGQAQLAVTLDDFRNEGIVASGEDVIVDKLNILYTLVKFNSQKGYDYYILGFKTEYWNTSPEALEYTPYFTTIEVRFDNGKVYTLPKAIKDFVKLDNGKYVGEVRTELNSSSPLMSTIIQEINNSNKIDVRVTFKNGIQETFTVSESILADWKQQVIPYIDPVTYRTQHPEYQK